MTAGAGVNVQIALEERGHGAAVFTWPRRARWTRRSARTGRRRGWIGRPLSRGGRPSTTPTRATRRRPICPRLLPSTRRSRRNSRRGGVPPRPRGAPCRARSGARRPTLLGAAAGTGGGARSELTFKSAARGVPVASRRRRGRSRALGLAAIRARRGRPRAHGGVIERRHSRPTADAGCSYPSRRRPSPLPRRPLFPRKDETPPDGFATRPVLLLRGDRGATA